MALPSLIATEKTLTVLMAMLRVAQAGQLLKVICRGVRGLGH